MLHRHAGHVLVIRGCALEGISCHSSYHADDEVGDSTIPTASTQVGREVLEEYAMHRETRGNNMPLALNEDGKPLSVFLLLCGEGLIKIHPIEGFQLLELLYSLLSICIGLVRDYLLSIAFGTLQIPVIKMAESNKSLLKPFFTAHVWF